jgi:CRP/FNR family transcriptional regulator, transcriptional activator FtrB
LRADDIEALRALPVLAGIQESTFKRIIVPSFIQSFPQGTTLIEERAPSDFLFFLMQGRVAMSAAWEGNDTIIEVLEPVTAFILAAVLSDRVSLQTATTLQPSRLLMVPASLVRDLMSEDSGFMRSVVCELADAYRRTVKELKNHKLRTSTERLANWLLDTASKNRGAAFSLPFEKRILAGRLGMTPENLSRAFATLSAHGVSINGSFVEIQSADLLADFAKPSLMMDASDLDLISAPET